MLAFAPDLPETTPEVLTAVSAVPTARGYRSPPLGIADGSGALADPSQGGALLLKLDGATRTIVGTVDSLYELSGGTWNDVSSGIYASGAARWRFAIFGNTSLAINKATQLQQGTLGAFAAVANAPKAACMDVADLFVCLGNCDDTGTGLGTGYGDQPHRWWISQWANPTGSWAPSASTRATSGLLVDTPGAITAMKRLGAYMMAYKEKGVYLGSFVGPPVELDFQCVSTDVGCPSGDAVVAAGAVHYFVGDDDIYAFDGTRPVGIGAAVKDWFFARLNRAYASSVQALHDRSNKVIYWFYPVDTASTLTSCLVYHYPTQRFGHFDLTVRDVLEAATSAVTYDDLGALYATYDDMPAIAYDSPFWNANTPILAYINAADTLMNLSGNGGPMSLTTGWIGDEATVSLCTRVRPKFRAKPTGGDITAASVMDLGGTVATQAASAINGDRFDVLQSARYHRFAINFDDQAEVEALGVPLQPEGEE